MESGRESKRRLGDVAGEQPVAAVPGKQTLVQGRAPLSDASGTRDPGRSALTNGHPQAQRPVEPTAAEPGEGSTPAQSEVSEAKAEPAAPDVPAATGGTPSPSKPGATAARDAGPAASNRPDGAVPAAPVTELPGARVADPKAPAATPVAMPAATPIDAPAHRPYRFAPITVGGETANINATLAVEHGKIDTFYQGAQQETLSQAAAQASQILSVGTTKYAELIADLDRRGHVAHGIFAAARANVTGIAGTQAALARADAQAAVVRLREDCGRQRTEAVAGATAEGVRMRAAAKEGGVRILQSGRATRDIVHGHVNGAMTTAATIEDADDKAAVTQALRSSSSSVREQLVEQGLADHDTLLEKAAGNEQTILGEARGLFEQRDEQLGEVEQGMISTGDQIAGRIGHLHMQQMIAIAQAEHQFLSKIVQLKTSAAKIIETSGDAAKRVNAVAQAQVATLHMRQAGANAGLDRVAQAAAAKLGEQKVSPQQLKQGSRLAQAELSKLGAAQFGAGREAHATEIGQLTSASLRFAGLLDDKIASFTSQLDAAQTQVTQGLADATASINGQCTTERATAETMYLGIFAQLSGPSWAKVHEARSTWRAQADKFGVDVKVSADDAIAKHAQIVAALPEKLASVSSDTVKERHKGWLSRNLSSIWNGFKAFVRGLGWMLLGLGALSILGIGGLMALAIVGLVGLAIGLYHRMKALIGAWGDWPWYAKVLGVIGTAFATVGDLVGLTGMLEGLFQHEAVTGREMSEAESVERFTVGALTAITAGLLKVLMPKGGAGAGRGGGRTAGELPPGEVPGETNVGEGAGGTEPTTTSGERSTTSQAKPTETSGSESQAPATSTEPTPTETQPATTRPAQTSPSPAETTATKPSESNPAETKPAEPKPAETNPVDTTPAGSNPAETKPAETKPAELTSPENKPAEQTTSATENKPAEGTNKAPNEPVESKPAETTSSPDTKPKTSDAADTNRSATKAADLKSGDSKTSDPSTQRADGRDDAKGASDEAASKSPDEATGGVHDAYSAFAKRHGLSEARAAELRAAGVDPKRLEALIKGGKQPPKPPEVAAQTALDEIQLAKSFERLGVAKGKKATTYARAAGDAGIIEKVNELLSHVGKRYRNPEKLGPIVESIRNGAAEHMQALDDALARMSEGHEVSIEAEADVVDHTSKEAIQHKQVKSPNAEQVGANIRGATKQLAGKGDKAEVPPPGYKRIADIRLKKENPMYEKSPSEIQEYLKQMKGRHDKAVSSIEGDQNSIIEGLAPDLEVRVTNATGTHRFSGPNLEPIP